LKRNLLIHFVFFILVLYAPYLHAQRASNIYRFYNTLSTTEKDCAEDLIPVKGLNILCQPGTAATSGEFVSDTVFNIYRKVYHNHSNWGLKYLNSDGIVAKTYTVQMYIKVTNFNLYYTRIIDFSDGTEDNGIYFTNYGTPQPSTDRCLNFYPNGNFGPCPFFNNHTYYLLTITRNSQTKLIDIYVNDQLFTSYPDLNDFYTSVAGKPIHIFRDDPVGFACEDGEANFAYLSFTNYYSSQADVAYVYKNINTIANSADFTVSPQNACVGGNVIVKYTGNIPITSGQYNFKWGWDGANTVSGSGAGPYTVSWAGNGTKTITLDITGGCANSTISNTKQVVINNPSASTVDTTVCTGQSYLGYTSTGTYTKTITSASGCDSVVTVHLTVLPPLTGTKDTVICNGQSYLGYNSTGTYTKTLTSTSGCDSVVTLHLKVLPAVLTQKDTIICNGQSYLGHSVSGTYAEIFTAASGCDSTVNIHLTVLPPMASVKDTAICFGTSYMGHNVAGAYTTHFTVGDCDSIATVNLTILPQPAPNLGAANVVCTGDSLLLNPGIFDNYLWQDGSVNSTYSVKTAGIYRVTVGTKCGTASVSIRVDENNCQVYFPTVFTPNGDNNNDVFKILNAYAVEKYQLSIFNRFGQMIFQTSNVAKGWDGTFNGKRQNQGTYVWLCNYTENNIVHQLKGTVVLIR